ncbi:MAG: DNA-directed RNA polymerase subunit beta, partial [Microbacteriaceae bacterium]|nr:DNA-directed RNA polymerase subunit beta [Microbacteriaceae bacterium]
VAAVGATSVADDAETLNPQRGSDLTAKALRLSLTAGELAACARLWQRGTLD